MRETISEQETIKKAKTELCQVFSMKPFIIPVIILVLIDQVIKIIIAEAFMQCEFDILHEAIRFNPVINTRLSYAGNYIDMFSSPLFAVILVALSVFLFLSGYMLYRTKRTRTSFSVKLIMICGIAGCLCSLIDKLFWGGSLDYIQIPNHFIFDLKDCYLTVAEIIFVVVGIIYSKEISVKEYLHFCRNKLK